MKQPRNQNDRLLRIILISWFLILLLFIAGTTYAVVEISKIKQNYTDLANRPTEVVKTIEKQMQPLYTTIEGKDGKDGRDGKDSMSTTTVIHTETAIPGPKGDTGKSGKNGVNGADAREQEFARDKDGNLYQRYVGTTTWYLVPVIEVP